MMLSITIQYKLVDHYISNNDDQFAMYDYSIDELSYIYRYMSNSKNIVEL